MYLWLYILISNKFTLLNCILLKKLYIFSLSQAQVSGVPIPFLCFPYDKIDISSCNCIMVLLCITFALICCTQCFFDTPGLMLKSSGYPYSDMRARVESAWSSVGLYDVLIVIFDVHRHLSRSVMLHPHTTNLILCSQFLFFFLFWIQTTIFQVRHTKPKKRLSKVQT